VFFNISAVHRHQSPRENAVVSLPQRIDDAGGADEGCRVGIVALAVFVLDEIEMAQQNHRLLERQEQMGDLADFRGVVPMAVEVGDQHVERAAGNRQALCASPSAQIDGTL